MKFIKRLFKIGEAEANAALNSIEDPINMSEQGIRDLHDDLSKAMEALAKVKSIVIRSKSDAENYAEKAKSYENKAILLLEKANDGNLDITEADRLATEALVKKQEMEANYKISLEEQHKNEIHAENLQKNINRMKSTISKWENELRTLKARHQVSEATKNINKQLAAIDSQSTVAMLERMKDRVLNQEALSEAYFEISNQSRTIDEEIDKALDNERFTAKESLLILKEKLSGKNENNA